MKFFHIFTIYWNKHSLKHINNIVLYLKSFNDLAKRGEIGKIVAFVLMPIYDQLYITICKVLQKIFFEMVFIVL